MLAALLPASLKAVMNIPVVDVPDEKLAEIMADLGLGQWHPELRTAALALLRGKGIDTAADAIRQPEALKQLSNLLRTFKAGASAIRHTSNEVCDFCGSPLVKEDKRYSRCTNCGIVH